MALLPVVAEEVNQSDRCRVHRPKVRECAGRQAATEAASLEAGFRASLQWHGPGGVLGSP